MPFQYPLKQQIDSVGILQSLSSGGINFKQSLEVGALRDWWQLGVGVYYLVTHGMGCSVQSALAELDILSL